jgi:hypothetical protein
MTPARRAEIQARNESDLAAWNDFPAEWANIYRDRVQDIADLLAENERIQDELDQARNSDHRDAEVIAANTLRYRAEQAQKVAEAENERLKAEVFHFSDACCKVTAQRDREHIEVERLTQRWERQHKLDVFAEAVVNAIGEISITEALDAIDKHRRELELEREGGGQS